MAKSEKKHKITIQDIALIRQKKFAVASCRLKQKTNPHRIRHRNVAENIREQWHAAYCGKDKKTANTLIRQFVNIDEGIDASLIPLGKRAIQMKNNDLLEAHFCEGKRAQYGSECAAHTQQFDAKVLDKHFPSNKTQQN